jgi:hypothetical protein
MIFFSALIGLFRVGSLAAAIRQSGFVSTN